MHRRAPALLAAAMGGLSLLYAGLQARDWARREPRPFSRFLDELDAALPRDARILLLVPDSARREGDPCRLNTRLYPRVVYALPPGVGTLKEASAWIAEKRLTWAVSIGGPRYDPRAAFVRRLDGDR